MPGCLQRIQVIICSPKIFVSTIYLVFATCCIIIVTMAIITMKQEYDNTTNPIPDKNKYNPKRVRGETGNTPSRLGATKRASSNCTYTQANKGQVERARMLTSSRTGERANRQVGDQAMGQVNDVYTFVHVYIVGNCVLSLNRPQDNLAEGLPGCLEKVVCLLVQQSSLVLPQSSASSFLTAMGIPGYLISLYFPDAMSSVIFHVIM